MDTFGNASPMSWPRLVSSKRLGLEQYHDPRVHSRSDFQRDYDRMIFSVPAYAEQDPGVSVAWQHIRA